MSQHIHNLGSLWSSYDAGDIEPSTYEEEIPSKNQQYLGYHPVVTSELGERTSSAHGFAVGPTMTYLDHTFPATCGPSGYSDSLRHGHLVSPLDIWTPNATNPPPAEAATMVHEPGSATNDVVPSTSTLPFHTLAMSTDSRFVAASSMIPGPSRLGLNISHGPAQQLATLSREPWDLRRCAPSAAEYASCQMVPGSSIMTLDIPIMAFDQPQDASRPWRSGSGGQHAWSLDYISPPNATSSQIAATDDVNHMPVYQQQWWPPTTPQPSDDLVASNNNQYTNEHVQTTKPVVPNTHSHTPPVLQNIHHVLTVYRVPIAEGYKKASSEFPVFRFNVNRQRGIRVIDALNGTAALDGAGTRDFAKTGLKQFHLYISWPGYKDFSRLGTDTSSPTKYVAVRDPPKSDTYIRRKELVQRLCERIEWYIHKCSKENMVHTHENWTLSEHSPTRIKLGDIWLISIHRIEKGGLWIPKLEVRR